MSFHGPSLHSASTEHLSEVWQGNEKGIVSTVFLSPHHSNPTSPRGGADQAQKLPIVHWRTCEWTRIKALHRMFCTNGHKGCIRHWKWVGESYQRWQTASTRAVPYKVWSSYSQKLQGEYQLGPTHYNILVPDVPVQYGRLETDWCTPDAVWFPRKILFHLTSEAGKTWLRSNQHVKQLPLAIISQIQKVVVCFVLASSDDNNHPNDDNPDVTTSFREGEVSDLAAADRLITYFETDLLKAIKQ